MAIPAQDIREWLESFEDADLIAIDEGGLALVGLAPSGALTTAYIEVGGVQSQRTACDDYECDVRPKFSPGFFIVLIISTAFFDFHVRLQRLEV